MRATRFSFLTALLIAGPLLSACSSNFDPTDSLDKLDFLNLNRQEKLKGERKPLFPEGVPGVSQGIPPDLIKGHQQAEAAAAPVAEPPPEKPKPKPRVVNRAPPKQKPTQVQVTVPQQKQQPQQAQQQPQQAQQGGAQSPWPEPQKQQTSPWPDAPAPNTFQR